MSFIHTPAGAAPASTSTDKKFALGTIGHGSNGTRWMYVQASAAISQYYVAAITEAFLAAPASAALGSEGHIPGFPQVAFAASDYGWMPISGSGDLKIKAVATKDGPLYVGSSGATSSGYVVTNTTSGTLLNGVVIVSTAASAGALPLIIANNPWFSP